jgi:hypothetical protein
MDNRARSTAQLYALVVGAVLVIVGILGFFVSTAFGTPGKTGPLLGLFDVNGWHNLVHIASGALLLAVAGRADTARTVVLAFGAVYVLVFILGLVMNPILGIIPVNGADNILHLLLALSAIGAGLASRDDRGAATARA